MTGVTDDVEALVPRPAVAAGQVPVQPLVKLDVDGVTS